MTTPDTMWSTLKVIVATAWIAANAAPHTRPTSSPMAGPAGTPHPRSLLKYRVPNEPVTVPMIISALEADVHDAHLSLNRPPRPVT